jgi:hypothetical protein
VNRGLDTPSGMSALGLAGNVVRRRGRKPSYWRVVGQAPAQPSNRKVVYLLNSCNDPELPHMLAIRVPRNSRAIPMLESVSVNRQPVSPEPVSPSPPNRGTPQSAEQPDPG